LTYSLSIYIGVTNNIIIQLSNHNTLLQRHYTSQPQAFVWPPTAFLRTISFKLKHSTAFLFLNPSFPYIWSLISLDHTDKTAIPQLVRYLSAKNFKT